MRCWRRASARSRPGNFTVHARTIPARQPSSLTPLDRELSQLRHDGSRRCEKALSRILSHPRLAARTGQSSISGDGCPPPLAANPGVDGRATRGSPDLRRHFTLPIWPCSGWGLPRPASHPAAGELLPHHFTLTLRWHTSAGRYVSVALSLGSPPLVVSQHPALWSSDFPRRSAAPGVLRRDCLAFSNRRTPRSIPSAEALYQHCARMLHVRRGRKGADLQGWRRTRATNCYGETCVSVLRCARRMRARGREHRPSGPTRMRHAGPRTIKGTGRWPRTDGESDRQAKGRHARV